MRSHPPVLLGLLALALVAACGNATGPAATGKAPDKVTFATAFGAAGRDGYGWVAAAKGYFRDENLDVTVVPGGGGGVDTQYLASGRAQFAVLDFSAATEEMATGRFTNMRAIAAIQQSIVHSVITLAGQHISTPRDLVGKTLGTVAGAGANDLFKYAYAKLAGFDSSRTNLVYAGDPAQLPVLLAAGRVNGILGYLMGAPSVEKAAGCTGCSVILPFSRYLADPYGGLLMASTSEITQHRDVVIRFSRALLKGLKYAIGHPDAAGRLLHRAQPATDAPTAAAELRLMAPYVETPGGPVGALDEARLRRGINSLASAGLYPAGLAPTQLADLSIAPKAGAGTQ